jgi:hypothetical protein
LDVNKNGYLTIEQFLTGFGEYDAGINDSSANLIVWALILYKSG